MKLRYSTWQAVSTTAQARDDKVSLKVQLEACIAVGSARGWIHVSDYTVPGQTRTQWTSLYHAEKNIPQLHDMLEAASRHDFDVLVVYDLNRFRDLMRQVFDALCDCGIQLYILSDPREPVAPADYTEERKNEVGLTVGLRDIISRSEITTLRKHYRDKMPRRITDKHLHPGLGLPPYGYRKPLGRELDSDAVLVQVPEQVRVLRNIKDWFLSGMSLTAIAQRLNDQGIPSPRGRKWWYSIVAYLLANPYYAGVVQFGSTQRIRNRRMGTVTRRKSAPIRSQGTHRAIWDDQTYQTITQELQRRGKAHPGIRTRQLSRLLHCWCGKVLWAQVAKNGKYWRCSSLQRGHTYLEDTEALRLVTEKIVYTLKHLDKLKLPAPEDNRGSLNAERQSLKTKMERLLDLYENSTIDKDLLQKRLDPLRARLQSTEDLLQQNSLTLARSASTRTKLTQLAKSVDTLPRYYQHAPPAQVNADLHALLNKITVGKDGELDLDWK